MQGVASARRIECDQAGPRLQRVADEALAFDSEAAYVLRARKRGGDRLFIAGFILERKVSGNVGVELWRAFLYRSVKVCNSGQIAVFDLNQVPRILRNRRRLRDDHRDRLADIAYAAEREDGVVGLAQLLAIFPRVADDIR